MLLYHLMIAAASATTCVLKIARADGPTAVLYTVKIPDPAAHVAEIEGTFPTAGRDPVDLMMAVWTPGFYRIEDYAQRISSLKANSSDGTALAVEHPQKNHWRIETRGAPAIKVTYKLSCEQRSVTTNWIGEEMAVLNGAATFLAPLEVVHRPYDVRLDLPAAWEKSVSALDVATDGAANHYRAADYDDLVDSPIVAGNPAVHEFEVDGSRHLLVDLGDVGRWNGDGAARDLAKIVEENKRLWGFLPYQKYVFLNVFRAGAGGLEHKNSCLLTANRAKDGEIGTAEVSLRWLEFACHEYFHAFNVKRLRPVELGPFDYENRPRTESLWVSEGLTVYYDTLLVVRAGLESRQEYLSKLSSLIGRLQKSPGRLIQTLAQSSLSVWTSGTSGVGQDESKTVSYYTKGPVVGFLLDAKIRNATEGKKSLDDLMRLAYAHFSGEHGFTPEQFRAAASEVAGTDLALWFRRAVDSTDELDYSEAMDWYGLRFDSNDANENSWKLAIRDDATEAQKNHLQKWLGNSGN
jgi:predicted metalloprotease with PDZ domain